MAGVTEGGGEDVTARVLHAFDATPEDVMAATAIVLATPANFGYMSGALKDFFDRIYQPCLERTVGLPYALVVKGDTDADGAVDSVERIVKGLGWKAVAEPLVVVGTVSASQLGAAYELGATIAAGVAAGIY
ncbi:MAG: NAD(P)H-dependent oxidoreductase [Acidimicrobiales bacterium]